jgi:hypothetical protein
MTFTPPKKTLDTICEKESPTKIYTSFPKDISQFEKEKTINMLMIGYVYQIAEYFRLNKSNKDITETMQTGAITSVINECLSNCYDHSSNRTDPVEFGLFLGDKGACYGFHDYGDYFKSKEIKEIYESKTPITTFNRNQKTSGNFGIGTNNFIYRYSDKIEVNDKLGILYVVQLKEKLSK